MPNYKYNTPSDNPKFQKGLRELGDTLRRFYIRNKSDIDAIMQYPGNPLDEIVMVAKPGAKAMLIAPAVAERFLRRYEPILKRNLIFIFF